MKRIIAYLKREVVLTVALLLMSLSMLLVPPDAAYLGYIDFRTLGLLAALMAVVGELRELGLFTRLCRGLSARMRTERALMLLSALLPFFLAMLVTNDVALITLVPLILILTENEPRRAISAVVLATVAANLGSAATPFGNPQNLYLSSFYALSAGDFFGAIAPLVGLSLVAVVGLALLFGKNERIPSPALDDGEAEAATLPKGRLVLAALLFLLCILAVLRAVPWISALLVTLTALFFTDQKALRHIDIGLLLTFVFFFVFVGNLARLEAVANAVRALIDGRALPVSALFSQVISNVPAALMLSSFTGDATGLVIGTNIGGLGTPIASMASLISLGFILKNERIPSGKYISCFLLWNFLLLGLFLAVFTLLPLA